MTEAMGFPPRWGFGPCSRTVTGGMHAQRSTGANCSVCSGVLSAGFIGRGVGVWKCTFATTTRRGDRLAHSGFIQRDLPTRHCHETWQERYGVVRSAVRGLPTEALAPAPFWLRCRTTIYTHSSCLNGPTRTRQRATVRWPGAHPTRFLPRLKPWVSALLNDERMTPASSAPVCADRGAKRRERLEKPRERDGDMVGVGNGCLSRGDQTRDRERHHDPVVAAAVDGHTL